MAREAVRLTPETTWGTYNSGGTPVYAQLDQNNQFTMRPVPNMWTIRSAGGYNRRVQMGSSTTGLNGALNVLLYGSQAASIMGWAVTPNAALTAMPSMTIDHRIQMEDGSNTVVFRRYLGVMVPQWVFTGAAQQQLMRLNLTLIGKQPANITGTDFPEPAPTNYPSDAPYVFQHSSGGFTFNGLGRTEFEQLTITGKNILDARFNESQYPTRIRWCGRDIDVEVNNVYQNSGDRTALYEGLTALTCSLVFTNGAHSLNFDMKTKNFQLSQPVDDLPLERVYYQKLSFADFFDAGNATDFGLTVA